jgi:hypothetical protein
MKTVKMEDGQQVQDGVEEPVVLEIVQVMKWIGFDEAKAERVAAQIGGKLRDFSDFELSHSDVNCKMLTENLRSLPAAVRIHINLA